MLAKMSAIPTHKVHVSRLWEALWTACGLVLGSSGQSVRVTRIGPRHGLLLLVARMEGTQAPQPVVHLDRQEVHRHRKVVKGAQEATHAVALVGVLQDPAAVREEISLP